jgi:hypothetical protein
MLDQGTHREAPVQLMPTTARRPQPGDSLVTSLVPVLHDVPLRALGGAPAGDRTVVAAPAPLSAFHSMI